MGNPKNLILPCAGNSSRFETDIPKFLLENSKDSNLSMVCSSIKGLPYTQFDNVYIVVLESHCNLFNVIDKLTRDFYKLGISIKIIKLKTPTKSSSETVYRCILEEKISGEIYIKDCDDYFEIDVLNPNEISVVSLNDCGRIHASNKSYVKISDQDIVTTIVEKNVISADFCCGLYSFLDVNKFIKSYEELEDTQYGEIYISHVIFNMILSDNIFKINRASNFIDWGTQLDWDIYLNS